MKAFERERRDWLLIGLILTLGMLLMYIVGGQAITVLADWSVTADMASHLLPNDQYTGQQAGRIIEPLRAEIGTPAAWLGTYLTPHAGQDSNNTPAPLVVFDPSATASPTEALTATAALTGTASATATGTPTPPVTMTGTPATATPTKTKTPKPPTSTTTVLPTTTTPTASPTTSTPTASPTTSTPTASPTTSTPTASPTTTTPTPSPSPTGFPVTLEPSLGTATPVNVNVGPPDGLNNDTNFNDGTYFTLNIPPIVVGATPDGNYDLVYYENGIVASGTPVVLMDQVIVGITNNDLWYNNNYTYYQVFNWGDGVRDTNTNVDTSDLGLPAQEYDNQQIDSSNLYEDPTSSPPPSNAQTGILIDVDGAPSQPPPGTYDMVVIIAPVVPPQSPPAPAGDSPVPSGQVDAIDTVDVLIP